MAQKRGRNKKRGSSKPKQSKQDHYDNSLADIALSNSGEAPLLQAASRDEHTSTALWTSPDTIPVEPAAVSSNNRRPMQTSALASFFSPPAPDFNVSPQRRPIHTPYSSQRQSHSLSKDPESDNESSLASEASPDRRSNTNGSTPGSSSSTSRHTSGLRDQVRDLDNLLTSPLTEHLGNLAEDATPSGTLGPIKYGDDDDMSEEWDHLGQSTHLLRQTLESYNLGSITSGKGQDSGSVPPGIKQQRLDPFASPIHPNTLFPPAKKTPAPQKHKSSAKMPPASPAWDDKKEETPRKTTATVAARSSTSACKSPLRATNDGRVQEDHWKGSNDLSNFSLDVDNSPGISEREGKESNSVAKCARHAYGTTKDKTRDFLASIDASSVSLSSGSSERLGHELDQLVNSMPLFDDQMDEAVGYNNLSIPSNQGRLSRSLNMDYMDPELSHLVQSVQEQLEASSTPETTPTKKKKTPKPRKRRTIVSVTKASSNTSPEASEGVFQVVTEDDEAHDEAAIEGDDIPKHPSDEANDYDEDDDLGVEMNQLEQSQHLMREALAVLYDDVSLRSKPTPKSPPQLTKDLVRNDSNDDNWLAQPMPLVPRKPSPQKQNGRQPLTFRSAATGTTATVTTMGATTLSDEDFHCLPDSPQAAISSPRQSERSNGMHSEPSRQATPIASNNPADTPISSTSNVTSLAGAWVAHSSPSPPAKLSRQQSKPQQLSREVPESHSQSPPAILTPEQVEQLQKVRANGSFPTPPSAVPSTRARPHIADGSYSTPTRPRSHSDGGVNTPGSRTSRGSAVKTLLVAPCVALQQLVRTPSPANSEGDHSTSAPFQFIEEPGDSSESSQSLVPFTPDELNDLHTKHAKFYPTLAKGTVSWEQEFEIESLQNLTRGDIEMADMDRDESPQGQSVYWIAYEYDRRIPDGHARETTRYGSDLLSNSQSRMKEIQQEHSEIEMQKVDNERNKIMSPSANMSSDQRRLNFRRTKAPLSTNLTSLDKLPVSPIGRGRSHSFSHRSPVKKIQSGTPSSVKSADTWGIQSRADGTKVASTLDKVLAELSSFRPSKGSRSPRASLSQIHSTSPIRQKQNLPSAGASPSVVYMNTANDKNSPDDSKRHLFLDIEDPDSSKPLDCGRKDLSIRDKTRRRRLWCTIVCLVWLILAVAIAVLTSLLLRGRSTRTSTSLQGKAPTASHITFVPTISPSATFGTIGSLPTANVPTNAFGPVGPTMHPTTSMLPQPGPRPTPRPTGSLPPVANATLSLASLLASYSVDVGEALLDKTSSEFKSLQWLAGNTFLNTYSDEQKVQRFVLGALYYSLNGDEWTLNARWLSDWDECLWFSRAHRYPVCNENGRYVSIELGYVDATGTIPNALGLLSSSLQRIDIQGGPTAFLTGTLPSELGLLTLMRDFSVGNNKLSGTIPPELKRWSFLEVLDLSGNSFVGALPFFSGVWPYLREGDLSQNFFSGTLMTEIGVYGRLSDLSLSKNLLSGPIPIHMGFLTNLQQLNLKQNNFVLFPSELGRMTMLQTLDLSDNKITNAIPPEIGSLTILRSMNLAFNTIRGTIPTQLGDLINLRDRLDLSYNSLTGTICSELGKLTQLRHLLLQSNKITGSLPVEVSALSRLNTFRVDHNNLSGDVSADICDVFNITLPYFYADCNEMNCPCCLFCCEDGDGCVCRYQNTENQYLCY